MRVQKVGYVMALTTEQAAAMARDQAYARPTTVLPDPGVTSNNKVACNEPMIVNGSAVGYCERLVKRRPKRLPKPHRGPHRVEWWTS